MTEPTKYADKFDDSEFAALERDEDKDIRLVFANWKGAARTLFLADDVAANLGAALVALAGTTPSGEPSFNYVAERSDIWRAARSLLLTHDPDPSADDVLSLAEFLAGDNLDG